MPRFSGDVNLAELTIGTVSERTGVPISVLRSWEQRHEFPPSMRTGGGHRRYGSDVVDQVLAVQRARSETGLSLAAAIERVRASRHRRQTSIAAGLRQRWPHLPTQVLAKPSMTALSRAIEDECCLRADRPVLLGAFQHERHYRDSAARWRSMARSAAAAAVLARFPGPPSGARRRRRGADGPVEVNLPASSPVLDEWAVICDAPDRAACLIGWERPGQERAPQAARRFEATWSVEPAVVRDAAHIAIEIAGSVDARHAALAEHLRPGAPADVDTVRFAEALTARAIAYLEAR